MHSLFVLLLIRGLETAVFASNTIRKFLLQTWLLPEAT